MRIPLMAGNWKMYKTVGEAVELVEGLLAGLGEVKDREVLVCPPYTALYALAPKLENTAIKLGAQNMYYEQQGAFTGDISPVMLKDVGCSYVILGHSERRHVFGETDELINRKVQAALANDLLPILCVGETKPERDAGKAEDVVVGQVKAGLATITTAQMQQVVIAYEPVWAIGTGDTATPEDAQAMHATIRKVLTDLYDTATAQAVRIQYGGSVKPNNVDTLMAQTDIDGALVGGASLKADDFLRIIHFQ